MAKRETLPQITPPDPDQIMLTDIAPVSIGERLGWLANQPMQPKRVQRALDVGFWDSMRKQLGMVWSSNRLAEMPASSPTRKWTVRN